MKEAHADNSDNFGLTLRETLNGIVNSSAGEIGVAVITDEGDTVSVGNRPIYPMMSVFKLHQALAVCHRLDSLGVSLDSVLVVRRDELDPDTWSPMFKEHPEESFPLRISELLKYTLSQSDNNASNLLFRKIIGVEETDRYVATFLPRGSFRIEWSEAEMAADHTRAYTNVSTPAGAAELIRRVYNDSLVSQEKQQFLMRALRECKTGLDRISAPLGAIEGVKVGHKTGSGYRNDRGELVAHNDVAYVAMPDGRGYAVAVFIKDYPGDELEASELISRLSRAVMEAVIGKTPE